MGKLRTSFSCLGLDNILSFQNSIFIYKKLANDVRTFFKSSVLFLFIN